MEDRPPDVRVDVAGVGAEPGVARVERLVLDDEASALDDLLDRLDLAPGGLEVRVPDGDGGREDSRRRRRPRRAR